jgi:RNA polymerase sigma-70 factor, ECF subfamily
MIEGAEKPEENHAAIQSDFNLAGCLAKVREGDEIAAGNLVRHLYPLVAYRIRLCPPRCMSEEDLAQIIFIKMFSNLAQYSGGHPFEHWVSRIAVNTCLTQIRRERARPEWRWSDLSDEEARVLENLAEKNEALPADQDIAARDLVEKLLQGLDPADQVLMRLLYLEGNSMAEIQQTTGWSSVGIRVKAFRARRKLKARLAILLKESVS